jgi:pyruvate ferredoxin oxidoreductase delta subunit
MNQTKEPGYKELPFRSLILEAGNSTNYETGGWRTFVPVHDEEKCIQCLFCWILCPDGAIKVIDGNFGGFDLKHCKGCGICAEECPSKPKAITMVQEKK